MPSITVIVPMNISVVNMTIEIGIEDKPSVCELWVRWVNGRRVQGSLGEPH